MYYRKFRADRIFNGYESLDGNQVLITTEDGVVEGIVGEDEAGDDVQSFKGTLLPGFINCHCHLELSHMKGLIGERTGLTDFLFSVVSKRQLPVEAICEAIENAETDMISNGIVAVGDICNNTLTIPQKSKGRLSYHNFIEVFGFNPSQASERFQQSLGHFHEYENHFSRNSIVPHAPYSVSNELWEKIVQFPGNRLMTIHNQEAAAENELFLSGKGDFLHLYQRMGTGIDYFLPPGKSSLQACLPHFKRDQSVILVHNVCTSDSDLEFASTSGQQLFWCFCPNANLYISGQLPAIDRFAAFEDRLVLGTDSLASNHSLSILSEIKTIYRSYPRINIDQLFRWATSNGAKALQMDELLGSFEAGKKPGVIVIDDELTAIKRLL
jgi:cytosine/adenosine deaminase-related metal-dependent hydrolase